MGNEEFIEVEAIEVDAVLPEEAFDDTEDELDGGSNGRYTEVINKSGKTVYVEQCWGGLPYRYCQLPNHSSVKFTHTVRRYDYRATYPGEEGVWKTGIAYTGHLTLGPNGFE